MGSQMWGWDGHTMNRGVVGTLGWGGQTRAPSATIPPHRPMHRSPRSCLPRRDPVLAAVPGDTGPAGRDRA